MKNIVFYFSGTGNSLVAAKEIAEKLGNCEIISMTGKNYQLKEFYENIGFVYPCYFLGMPVQVQKYISNLDFSNQKNPYVFGISTCGGSTGNALPQLNSILESKGVSLNYSSKLKMFSNYVVMYNMKENADEKTQESKKDLEPIIKDILSKKYVKTGKGIKLIDWYYNMESKKFSSKDNNFNISDTCNGCTLCSKVCPVQNIEMKNNKPTFRNNCEQCTACIQFCPQKSINYKQKTQKRRRYTHPEITSSEIIERLESRR